MAFMAAIKKVGMSQAGRGGVQPTDLSDIRSQIGGSDAGKPPAPSGHAASSDFSPQQPGPMRPDAGPGPKAPQVYAGIERVLKAAEFNQKETEFGQQLSANLDKSPLMNRGRSMNHPFDRNR